MSHWSDAWYHVRTGCAWQLLAWAFQVMPKSNPIRRSLAIAIRENIERSYARPPQTPSVEPHR